jgi:hypothetical protein
LPYSVLPQQDTRILDPTLVRAAYRDLDGVGIGFTSMFSHLISAARRNILAPAGKILE